MSTRLWKCRNPRCPIPHGEILGRLTVNGSLDLDHGVSQVRIYLDTRHVVVMCPRCGAARSFHNGPVFLNRMLE